MNVKEKILLKANELFLQNGIKDTTMDNIAKALGISKKTLYTHFESKDQLVRESVEHIYTFLKSKLDEICQMELDPYEEFFVIRRIMREYLGNIQISPQYQLKKYYPDLAKELERKKFDNIMNCLGRNLARGIEKGYYKKNLDTEFIKRLYFGNSMLLGNPELFPPEKFDRYRLSNAFMKFFLHGISTKAGRKRLKEIEKKYGL